MNIGIAIKDDKIKTAPESKSIQLPNSLNMPKKDFAIRIIPKINKSVDGSFIPAPNNKINPDIMSIAPKALISMFFKSKCYLKMCACCSMRNPNSIGE